MDPAIIYYLGTTLLLSAIFAAIVVRICGRKRREKVEAPKYRMMNDD